MLRIKNLINSPYEIMNADGERVMLPAGGEIDVDVHPMHLPTISVLGYFQIGEIEGSEPKAKPKAKPKADDPAVSDEIVKLRADYQEIVGKRAYHGWDVAELQKRIDEALAA